MTGGGPVLLRTNMGAGGASGRSDRLDEVAIVYALCAVGGGDRGGLTADQGYQAINVLEACCR